MRNDRGKVSQQARTIGRSKGGRGRGYHARLGATNIFLKFAYKKLLIMELPPLFWANIYTKMKLK